VSTYFADTSALIKRYVAEPGSAWVRSWVDPSVGNTIVISRLTTVEVVAGLARRQRENSISPVDFTTLRGRFIFDVDKYYVVIGLRKYVLTVARNLAAQYPLRALDAIQLACALETRKTLGAGMILVAADHRLLTAARAEGFATDDPNLHP
jgi:predicted nucleic acid-binding protein